jgi:serine/threonine-protein kinase
MIEKLGKYNIIGELGQGAMGTVYKGEDPLIGRVVAIKTINSAALAGQDAQEAAARFKQEAQAAGRLSHPNIVVVYDYGEEGDTAFIAMAFVEGRELKTYFDQNEVFALSDIVHIMDQLLDALNFAHVHKIVHRDIKPGNIIVNDNGNIMITDFGIARLENSDLTQVGATMGTPNYMAPEQCMGQRIDGRADIFSAAVILYQLLTGEKPFAGANIASIMHKILKVDPVPPSELNLQVPKAFDALIAKGLAKRPEDRFATADDFRKALKDAVNGIAVDLSQVVSGNDTSGADDETVMVSEVSSDTAETSAADQTVLAEAVDDDATVLSSPPPAAPVEKPAVSEPDAGGKKKFVPIIAGVFFLVLVIGGGVFMFSGDRNTDVVPPLIETQNPTTEDLSMPVVSEAGIFVETVPDKATVLLDGKTLKGVTPLNLEVSAGHHELLLSKDGYFTVPVDVDINKGDMVPLAVSLYRK